MKCGTKNTMDLYKFISRYDIEKSPVFVMNAGKDDAGKDRYSFYAGPTLSNGFYCKDFFKVTFTPEVDKVEYIEWGMSQMEEWKDFTFEDLIKENGIGLIKVDDHLFFADGYQNGRQDVFVIECLDQFRCTIHNATVEVERIPKKEFDGISNSYYGKD